MNHNNHSRFFHHFMSKQIPCIILPSVMPSSILIEPSSDDHILNLSASMKKHCPLPSPSPGSTSQTKDIPKSERDSEKERNLLSQEPDCSTSILEDDEQQHDLMKREKCDQGENVEKKVDLNSNHVKQRNLIEKKFDNDNQCDSDSSESSRSGGDVDGPTSEIDVDEMSCDGEDPSTDFENETIQSKHEFLKEGEKKSKPLNFGIDRILSKSQDDKDKTSPTPSGASFPSPGSPRVVSLLSGKSDNSGDAEKLSKNHLHHHSILSKLKLCTMQPNHSHSESHKTPNTLPYFHHHSYGPYRHPHPHHHHHQNHHNHNHHQMNSIISTPGTGGLQAQTSSHCSECLFLRRYCGNLSSGQSHTHNHNHNRSNNIPSSSSSTTSNSVTNNMQFSSPLTTPCGPTSSSISASFTWMANPSIYDNSAVLSPVTGFNQHIPLQSSFGMSSAGFSTLATIHQQCNSGGGGSGRRKRSWSRAVFSNLQRKGLEKRFQIQKYITKPDRRQLAATLGLTDAQVKVWFQNRRMKWRNCKNGGSGGGTGLNENGSLVTSSSSSPPVSSTTSTKPDGAMKDKKA